MDGADDSAASVDSVADCAHHNGGCSRIEACKHSAAIGLAQRHPASFALDMTVRLEGAEAAPSHARHEAQYRGAVLYG